MSIQSSLNQTLALMGGLASINPQLSERVRLKERAGELGRQVDSLNAQNEALTERNDTLTGENKKLQTKYDDLQKGVDEVMDDLIATGAMRVQAEQKAKDAEERYQAFDKDVSDTLYKAAVIAYGEDNLPEDISGKQLILDLAGKVANMQAQKQEVAKLIKGKRQKQKFDEIFKGGK